MAIWYKETQNDDDIILSSRIRLARNLKNYPFITKLNDEGREKIVKEIKKSVMSSNSVLKDMFEYTDITKTSPLERHLLKEERLISEDMVETKGNAGLLVDKDKNVSIMICEEDHIRLQCIYPGLNLEKAYDMADKIDNVIEETVDYAFSPQYGYLTACPTNVGTGLRASVMVHIPAINICGRMKGLADMLSKLGLTVRGLFGEGSEADGYLYQISNQITLGVSENEIIDKLKNAVESIVTMEKTLRQELKDNNPVAISDRVWRSYGTLKYAQSISGKEAKQCLSDCLLGKNMGIINTVDNINLKELMVLSEPAHISKAFGKDLKPEERDVKRAEFIRSII